MTNSPPFLPDWGGLQPPGLGIADKSTHNRFSDNP